MDKKNNIYTLFERLASIDALEENSDKKLQEIYHNFFITDQNLVTEKSRICSMDDEQILLKDGRFSLDHKGAHFEAFYKNAGRHDTLIVSFGVARPWKSGPFQKDHPVFIRWKWTPFIDGHMLCFEDPMYYLPPPIGPNLKIGWFYGNENEDYAVYTAEIIKKLAKELNITNNNIILYGSSAGGTAAIRVGAAIKESKTVAINPQLNICRHSYTAHFTELTNFDLSQEDKFNRNKLAHLIKSTPDSKFLLIVNLESRHDIEIQLGDFLNKWGYKQKPGFGLSKLGNTAIWIYDAPGRQPHNVMEDYRIYPYIRYLLNSFDEDGFVQKHQKEVLYINDWWRSQAQARYENQLLKEENELIKARINALNTERLKNISNGKTAFNEIKTARIDIINHSGSESDISTDLKWIKVSDNTARVQTPLWFLKDGQGYVLQSDKCEINFKFKCVGNGNLEFFLRGIYKRDKNGKNIPYWLDYTYFAVNGETIFSERKNVWHNKPYKFTIPVKNGDIIECSAAWEEHIE